MARPDLDALRPPDRAFLEGLADAWRISPDRALQRVLRPPEPRAGRALGGSRISRGAFTALDLSRRLGALEEIPGLERLRGLRSLSCPVHGLLRLDLAGNPELMFLDCSAHIRRQFTVDITGCRWLLALRFEPVRRLEEELRATLICTELQRRRLDPALGDAKLEARGFHPQLGGGFEVKASGPEELDHGASEALDADDLRLLSWIVQHPACDAGTALRAYWRLGPSNYRRWRLRAEVPPALRAGHDVIRAVERGLSSGGYPIRQIAFDPRNDLGIDRIDLDRRALEGDEGPEWALPPSSMRAPTAPSALPPLRCAVGDAPTGAPTCDAPAATDVDADSRLSTAVGGDASGDEDATDPMIGAPEPRAPGAGP